MTSAYWAVGAAITEKQIEYTRGLEWEDQRLRDERDAMAAECCAVDGKLSDIRDSVAVLARRVESTIGPRKEGESWEIHELRNMIRDLLEEVGE
jgi:hypothetical protein